MAYKRKSQKPAAKKEFEIDHGTLITWVNEADDATQESREISEKCRDYYDSKQWTDDEAKTLQKRGQAATVINRIKPKMDGLMGLEKQNRTTAKGVPRTPKHEKAATACTEAIRFVLQDNTYHEHRSNAWGDIIVEGTGGVEVIAEEVGEEFRITINPMYWDRLIYDPHSRRKSFADARFKGQVVWMDYDEAAELYPDGAEVLEDMQDSNSSTYDDKPRWMDNTRRRVKIVELYYRYRGDVWYACFTRGGFLKAPQVSPYVNEEGETEDPYEFASGFVDGEGQRYGAVKQLLDVQDEVNKRRSKALHLMSVRQVRSEKGAVEDVNKARAELAKPDGWIETTPGMEMEVLKTGDMAAAQFNLLTEAKQEIDSVGFNAALSGKDENLQSGRALIQRAATGQTELAPLFDVLKNLDIRVYRKVWNRIKQYWKAEKWVRLTDDEQNLRWVGLNVPMTKGQRALEDAQEQGLPPEQLQMLAQQIAADPTSNDPETKNNVAELDMDIVITDAPDAATTAIEDFQVLGEMVKSGFQMPPLAVIEASPLSNKEKILKMMKEDAPLPPQVQEQMGQMQEAVKKLSEENQQLKSKAGESAAKLDQDGKQMRAKMFLQKEQQDGELDLQEQRDIREAKLARDKAQAAHDLAVICDQREADLCKAKNERDNKQVEFDNDLKIRQSEGGDSPRLDAVTEKVSVIEQILQDALTQMMQIVEDAKNEMIQTVENAKTTSVMPVMDSAGRIVGGVVKEAGGGTRRLTVGNGNATIN